MRDRMNRYPTALAGWHIVYRVDDEIVMVAVLKVGKKHGPDFYAGIE
jgi:hypothetical protein